MSGGRDFQRVFGTVRLVAGIFLGAGALVWLITGLFSVEPDQQAVVKLFGRVRTDSVPPGIHWHWPWPVESVRRLKVTSVRTLHVGFRGGRDASGRGGQLLTGDQNLVEASLKVNYTVRHAARFLYTIRDVEGLLSRLAEVAMVASVSAMSVDDVLTEGRYRLRADVRTRIQDGCDRYGLGIHVSAVHLDYLGPPPEVAQAFKEVASARGNKQKLIRKAQGERNRDIPKARAEANSMLRDAEAYANEIVTMARGDTDRFVTAWREYRRNPDITSYRLYLETVEIILLNATKQITDPDAERYMVPTWEAGRK